MQTAQGEEEVSEEEYEEMVNKMKEDNDWDDEIEDFDSSVDEIGDLLRGL